MRILSQVSRLLLATLALSIAAYEAGAEIIRTGPLTYQDTNGRFKTVLTPEGFFIFHSKAPVDLQLFNPGKVQAAGAEHLFIRFDSSLNKYSEIQIGERSFRITGSLTLNLGKEVTITIDNDNVYCSVVVNSEGANPPSIIGLLGLNVVVNNTGQAAVTLLQGNQFNDIKSIQPYEVADGKLRLKGKPYENNSIGLLLEPTRNTCLSGRDAAIIRQEDLVKISAVKDQAEKAKQLRTVLERAKSGKVLDQLVKLRVLADSILVFDPIREEIALIRYRAADAQKLGSNLKICIMESLQVS